MGRYLKKLITPSITALLLANAPARPSVSSLDPKCHLLNIPQEILDEIIGYTLGKRLKAFWPAYERGPDARKTIPTDLAILRSSAFLSSCALRMMFSSSIFQFSIVPDAPDFSSFPTQEATDLMQNVEFHVCETVPRDTNEGIEAIYAKTFDKITGSRTTLRDQCRIHLCLPRGDNVANSKPITRFLRSFSVRSWKKLKGFCTVILEVDPLQFKLRYSLGPGVMRSPVDVAGNPVCFLP